MQNVSKCTLSMSKVTQWIFSGHSKESTLRINCIYGSCHYWAIFSPVSRILEVRICIFQETLPLAFSPGIPPTSIAHLGQASWACLRLYLNPLVLCLPSTLAFFPPLPETDPKHFLSGCYRGPLPPKPCQSLLNLQLIFPIPNLCHIIPHGICSDQRSFLYSFRHFPLQTYGLFPVQKEHGDSSTWWSSALITLGSENMYDATFSSWRMQRASWTRMPGS